MIRARVARAAAALTLVLWVTAPLALAHHSVLPFDGAHGTTIAGTVTRFLWQNPHTLIALDVSRPDGAVEHWMIESESPRILERLGWSDRSLEVGVHVTVEGAAAKDGSLVMRCRAIELGDGRRLPCF
jgi:hypothetical protein